jgi:hypothetical protein
MLFYLVRNQHQRNHSTIIVNLNKNFLRPSSRFHTTPSGIARRRISNSKSSTQAPVCTQVRKMVDVETMLAGKYPAKAHAKRVVEWMRKTNPDVKGVLYLEGQKTRMIEDNDETMPFRFVLHWQPTPPLTDTHAHSPTRC